MRILSFVRSQGCLGASQMVLVVKNPPAMHLRHERRRFDPWVGKIPWRRKWQPFRYSCLEYHMNRGSWLAQSMRSHRVRHN